MDFYPGLDELHFVARDFAFENFSIGNGYYRFVFLVFHMYVWPIMLLCYQYSKGIR